MRDDMKRNLERHGGRVLNSKPPGDGSGNSPQWFSAPAPKPTTSRAVSLDRTSTATAPIMFDSMRGEDGKVREQIWDHVCIPGDDMKNGQATSFNLETLSQMAENFEQRGDVIPLDHDHQSVHSQSNGQPAPALAYYGAVAVVWGGRLAKLCCARGVTAAGSEEGLDLSRDGLWALRTEVTEIGQELIPNYKYVSPTFLPNATDRSGEEIGYAILAVAATNVPWQPNTALNFAMPLSNDPVVKARLERAKQEAVFVPRNAREAGELRREASALRASIADLQRKVDAHKAASLRKK